MNKKIALVNDVSDSMFDLSYIEEVDWQEEFPIIHDERFEYDEAPELYLSPLGEEVVNQYTSLCFNMNGGCVSPHSLLTNEMLHMPPYRFYDLVSSTPEYLVPEEDSGIEMIEYKWDLNDVASAYVPKILYNDFCTLCLEWYGLGVWPETRQRLIETYGENGFEVLNEAAIIFMGDTMTPDYKPLVELAKKVTNNNNLKSAEK